MDPLSILNAAAAIATALGLAFAVIQLRIAAKQAVLDFEDTLAAEYRALAASLPIEALLGGTLSDEEHQDALDEFYHYFDLSNGQIFLRRKGRVSKPTFSFWCSGIKAHLTRPAFARAWTDINTRLPNDFKDLRRLIEAQYQGDPKDWDRTLSYARQP